ELLGEVVRQWGHRLGVVACERDAIGADLDADGLAGAGDDAQQRGKRGFEPDAGHNGGRRRIGDEVDGEPGDAGRVGGGAQRVGGFTATRKRLSRNWGGPKSPADVDLRWHHRATYK